METFDISKPIHHPSPSPPNFNVSKRERIDKTRPPRNVVLTFLLLKLVDTLAHMDPWDWGIFTYIWLKSMVNVGKDTLQMESIGILSRSEPTKKTL